MGESYCGKRCDECPARPGGHCAGCKDGPGSSWSGDCEIARCCRSKGHESCGTCTLNGHCALYSGRMGAQMERERRREAEDEARRRNADRAPLLAKWLTVLFWLVIPNIIIQVMTNENVLELLPELYWPGTVLSILYMFAYGGVLYVLRGESGRYRTAGTLLLISGVISVVMLLAFSANAFAVIVSLAASVIVFVAEYQEYMGHAEVLAGTDSYLADRWRGLWRWMIYAFAASVGGALAALLFVQAAFLPLLFLLVSVAGMIALLVLGILKLVYLWRTARVFRELAG